MGRRDELVDGCDVDYSEEAPEGGGKGRCSSGQEKNSVVDDAGGIGCHLTGGEDDARLEAPLLPKAHVPRRASSHSS